MKKLYERPTCATIVVDHLDIVCASNTEAVNELSVKKLFPTLTE